MQLWNACVRKSQEDGIEDEKHTVHVAKGRPDVIIEKESCLYEHSESIRLAVGGQYGEGQE